jgi:hypothetical protein
VPALRTGQLCCDPAKASSDGAGSHFMKRVNVGVVASNASNASSDAKDFRRKRCDDKDTELRSTANSTRSGPIEHSLMSPPVQVFGRRQRRSDHTLRQPASEKRLGTKSREVDLGRPCPRLSYGDLGGERATSSIGSGRREIERLQRCDARCGPAVIGLEPQSDDSGKIGARAKNLSEPGRVQAER